MWSRARLSCPCRQVMYVHTEACRTAVSTTHLSPPLRRYADHGRLAYLPPPQCRKGFVWMVLVLPEHYGV